MKTIELDLTGCKYLADKLTVKGENSLPKKLDEQLAIFHETLDEYIEFREKYKNYGLNTFEYEIID